MLVAPQGVNKVILGSGLKNLVSPSKSSDCGIHALYKPLIISTPLRLIFQVPS